mmetsp:Transcript_28947/g.79417  ORF Transcript_28947/g.79417 Transcript_28947/m.79417 type:complete len:202 (-) Transcript_28947:533-1138(-)
MILQQRLRRQVHLFVSQGQGFFDQYNVRIIIISAVIVSRFLALQQSLDHFFQGFARHFKAMLNGLGPFLQQKGPFQAFQFVQPRFHARIAKILKVVPICQRCHDSDIATGGGTKIGCQAASNFLFHFRQDICGRKAFHRCCCGWGSGRRERCGGICHAEVVGRIGLWSSGRAAISGRCRCTATGRHALSNAIGQTHGGTLG